MKFINLLRISKSNNISNEKNSKKINNCKTDNKISFNIDNNINIKNKNNNDFNNISSIYSEYNNNNYIDISGGMTYFLSLEKSLKKPSQTIEVTSSFYFIIIFFWNKYL